MGWDNRALKDRFIIEAAILCPQIGLCSPFLKAPCSDIGDFFTGSRLRSAVNLCHLIAKIHINGVQADDDFGQARGHTRLV